MDVKFILTNRQLYVLSNNSTEEGAMADTRLEYQSSSLTFGWTVLSESSKRIFFEDNEEFLPKFVFLGFDL